LTVGPNESTVEEAFAIVANRERIPDSGVHHLSLSGCRGGRLKIGRVLPVPPVHGPSQHDMLSHAGLAPRMTDREVALNPQGLIVRADASVTGPTPPAREPVDVLLPSTTDASACAEIVKTHARTFTLASYLLPATKRRAAYALYAFCRIADDLVDRATPGTEGELAAQLGEYERQLAAALAGRPSSAVFREIAWVSREYEVPPEPLYELLAGVAEDLRPTHYRTWRQLESYCEGVASSVGEMCTHVFGVPGGPDVRLRAVRYARTLGVAMQLTNILRDIGEDANRGRCYLPDEDLAMFGLSRHEVLTNRALPRDERWRPMMAFEVGRARALYEAALPGIALLSHDAHRCARACAIGYAGILGAIEAQGYDTVSSRARLGRVARMNILWDAWRFRAAPLDTATVGDGPTLLWDRPVTDSASEIARLA
jgi:15-cis-phytoene synthase